MPRVRGNICQELKPFSSVLVNVLEIQKLLVNCKTILDVGCGASSNLRFLQNCHLTGVDAFAPDLEKAKILSTHDDFILCDIRKITKYFKPKEFDACVALDVIEHLSKVNGLRLIYDLEQLAREIVVIFTPNGFLPQRSSEQCDFQEHLSGWEASEMQNLGYTVIGMDGLKYLRTDHHRLKLRPFPFWAVISWLTQYLWCKHHPESAAAILCWKVIPEH